tara:strand:- start:1549 stop:1722 length:174 start_codon:yes stop_codon:yes gene_type:complete
MAKETDLLKDPLSLAQQRYQEQVNAFKSQYLPKPKNPVREFLKEIDVSKDEWQGLFK